MKTKCCLSICVTDEEFDVLMERAVQIGMSVSDMLGLFASDLAGNSTPVKPAEEITRYWHSVYVPDSNNPAAFITWLHSSSYIKYFFCLLDSIFCHVKGYELANHPLLGHDADEQALNRMEDILDCALGDEDSTEGKPCRREMEIFPQYVQDFFCSIISIMVSVYDEYAEETEISKEDRRCFLDILLAFHLWKDRVLRY